MHQELLLGNEAVGLGALHAGLSAAFGYPGTPSTEIFEFIQSRSKEFDVRAIWSANEKVALEEALGMSFAGKRAIVTMKHVGLNVAADPFMNAAMTGVKGGLVVAVGDDPGMHSSQNEQDSRYYADFARIPCFEPATQQEAYDMMEHIFEVSEKFDTPVLLRMVTRLCHSRSNIMPRENFTPQKPLDPADNWRKWVLLPVNARKKNIQIIQKQTELITASDTSAYNELKLDAKATFGIIASGIAYNYVAENLNEMKEPFNILKISQYPLPMGLIRKIVESSDEILVVEEGYPLIESRIQGMFGIPGKTVRGKLSGDLPPSGEMNPDHVRSALGLPKIPRLEIPMENISGRPPMLCVGCPHSDTFNALAKAVEDFPDAKMFTDIGCYTLGVLPPYNCGETCVDMGASVSMAYGASSAGITPTIAIIGDSTFIHSGMTPLVGAAKENADMNVVIMDNALVAMTGAQETMVTGQDLVDLVASFGIPREHIRTFRPLAKYHDENVRVFKEELAYHGLSVIIPQRPCIHAHKSNRK